MAVPLEYSQARFKDKSQAVQKANASDIARIKSALLILQKAYAHDYIQAAEALSISLGKKVADDLCNFTGNNPTKETNLNVIKMVQALMLLIDFTTPLWIKTLILSLHHLKNMDKHFRSLSNNYPDLVIELEQIKAINYNEVIIDEENDTNKKFKNEFDESLERSTISQSATVNYDQILDRKNKPSEAIVLTKEELLEVFLITLCTAIAHNSNLDSYEHLCDNMCDEGVDFLGNVPKSIEVY